MRLAIVGGRVFDPAGGEAGQERDLYSDNGYLVEYLPTVDQVLNVHGLAVTPAGLEIRSSVARFGQNFLRLWGGGCRAPDNWAKPTPSWVIRISMNPT